MQCHILFSGKNKRKKYTSLSSAELAESVIKVKTSDLTSDLFPVSFQLHGFVEKYQTDLVQTGKIIRIVDGFEGRQKPIPSITVWHPKVY